MLTFNATYVWLGINITGRLFEHTVTTPNGLLAENVELRLGDHWVTVSIADISGKSGRGHSDSRFPEVDHAGANEKVACLAKRLVLMAAMEIADETQNDPN
jgi:hypothetical protein